MTPKNGNPPRKARHIARTLDPSVHLHADPNPASHESLQDYAAMPVRRPEHADPSFTRLLEQQSAKIPSHFFLALSLGAMGLSLALELRGRSRASRFIGMWPPALLVMGVYNKMVKTSGVR